MSMAPIVISPRSGQHRSTCIFLHGRGDTGAGWVDVALLLAKKLPFTKFILPHAPRRPVTFANGFEMPAWYDVYDLIPSAPQDKSGIIAAAKALVDLVDAEIAASTGITREHVIIGGFSQGGAVALTSGLLYKNLSSDSSSGSGDFAGIMALSTYLPLHDHFAENADLVAKKTPILMIHGDQDTRISPQWAKASLQLMRNRLQCRAIQFQFIPGLGHHFAKEELDMMVQFMRKHLKE